MSHNHIFLLFLIIILQKPVVAQKSIFDAGAILGINIASLPNDEYNYTGLNSGLFCDARTNQHYHFKIEILFSQNGEYILPKFYPDIDYGKIRINYIEVPLHFDFYLNSFKSTKFLPDWTLEIGGAYAKLFSWYAEDRMRNNLTNQVVYNYKNSFLFQFGTTIFYTKHIGISIRFSKPLVNPQLDLTGSLRMIYRL